MSSGAKTYRWCFTDLPKRKAGASFDAPASPRLAAFASPQPSERSAMSATSRDRPAVVATRFSSASA